MPRHSQRLHQRAHLQAHTLWQLMDRAPLHAHIFRHPTPVPAVPKETPLRAHPEDLVLAIVACSIAENGEDGDLLANGEVRYVGGEGGDGPAELVAQDGGEGLPG
jgi:hypothetical protein